MQCLVFGNCPGDPLSETAKHYGIGSWVQECNNTTLALRGFLWGCAKTILSETEGGYTEPFWRQRWELTISCYWYPHSSLHLLICSYPLSHSGAGQSMAHPLCGSSWKCFLWVWSDQPGTTSLQSFALRSDSNRDLINTADFLPFSWWKHAKLRFRTFCCKNHKSLKLQLCLLGRVRNLSNPVLSLKLVAKPESR